MESGAGVGRGDGAGVQAPPRQHAGPIVRVRYGDGGESAVPVDSVHGSVFEDVVPWRSFRWYRGQQHFPGSYWSATMLAPVGYESRLELAWLLLADFDPDVARIVSQPFLLEGLRGGVIRRHVPDYLLVGRDGSVQVVDVKPSDRLMVPAVRSVLEWTRSVVESVGWQYRVCTEPGAVRLVNVRFLAGYRRARQFEPVPAVRSAVTWPAPFAEVERAIAGDVGGRSFARAMVLHLLWTGEIYTDLDRLLSAASVLEAR